MPEQSHNPATESSLVLAQRQAVTICRDVWGGTLTMRERGRTYLPQFPMEGDDAYRDRLASAVLYNAYKRSVKGLVGMIFRKAPTLGEDVPDEIKRDAENIDAAGRHLDVFLRDACEDGMVDGHAHILVDYPNTGPDQFTTRREERDADLRPYWVLIGKRQVLRAYGVTLGGHVTFAHFAYLEDTIEPDPPFGEREVKRVRQYTLVDGGVQLDTWVQEGEDWRVETEGKMLPLRRIPVATFYAGRTGYQTSEPPLLDLALENILHYQTRSDRQNSLHTASVPIPLLIGVEDDESLTWAANRAIKLPVGGDGKYLEPTGAALTHSREELQDIEQRMAALGLSMLQRQTRAAETAEAKRIDKAEADSQLAAIAYALQDAAEEALGFHAEWRGLEIAGNDGGSIEINRDFGVEPLDPQMVRVLSDLVGEGRLSVETLWDMLERGDILPDTFDPEVERERLERGGVEAIRALALAAREGGEGEDEPERQEAA